ncbi:MAG: MFS transporter [Candidatus Obscuribacterales bacterium]|nr:MFS transporter [Candidatus Obscuribacterales bacterium]
MQTRTVSASPEQTSDLTGWNPEDEQQWESIGKKIAFKNLAISIPCLLCGFAVWMYWGVITVQMLNLGFPYSKEQLFTLMSIAGLSGATLRIPSTFLIRMAGGRNTIFFTTMLLILPALGTGIALSDIHTPMWVFQLLALLSGFGGGNFASSMSNISFFFPKRMQGLSLGLNAGVGNFGVTVMQILVPLAMTFGFAGQKSMILSSASGTLIGKIPAGTATYIQNAGYVWVLVLVPLVALSWFLMNNIRDEHVSPDIGSSAGAIAKVGGMLSIGVLTSVLGCYAMFPTKAGGLGLNQWLVLPMVIAATVFLLKLLPGKIKPILERQYKIFGNKHTWIMTIIYTMTFGSFIGYAAAFPLAIQVIFGFSHVPGADGVMTHTIANPNAPSALTYAWMGAFIGAFIRPIGGWLSDRVGGALVTQISSLLMVVAAVAASYYLKLAYSSASPEQYFVPFFLTFLLLFLASGTGNGSTFRSIAAIFSKEQAGPVLGWTSAIAAYGAFIIPKVLGEQIEHGTPEYALYGFAAFYMLCVALNWWFYLRPGAEFKNP